jgi:hypothetical protein
MKTEAEIRAEERERVAKVFQERGEVLLAEAREAKDNGWQSVYFDLRSQGWRWTSIASEIRLMR